MTNAILGCAHLRPAVLTGPSSAGGHLCEQVGVTPSSRPAMGSLNEVVSSAAALFGTSPSVAADSAKK
jgi:hypothetical protein